MAKHEKIPRPATSTISKPMGVPISYFELCHPMRPLARFSWDAPAERTNAETFFLQVETRRIPLRLLRRPNGGRERPTLLLLHGMGLHIASFAGIAGYLLDVCNLLLVDYNSYGYSPGWPPGGISLREMMRGAMRVPLALGIRRLAIGGSSLGGGLSLMAALEFPERITAVTTLNPACYPQELPWFYRVLRTPIIGELAMLATSPETLVAGIASVGYENPARMSGSLRRIYHETMKPLANRLRLMDAVRALPSRAAEMKWFLARTKELQQPVQVIWGARDELLPSDTAEKLRSDLADVSVYELPDLAHLPHEEAPATVGPLMAQFLIDKMRP